MKQSVTLNAWYLGETSKYLNQALCAACVPPRHERGKGSSEPSAAAESMTIQRAVVQRQLRPHKSMRVWLGGTVARNKIDSLALPNRASWGEGRVHW